jgi:HEXXH motif-containing protein
VTLTGQEGVNVLTAHTLPEVAFTALAEGGGDPDTIRLLRDAQLSKHLLLLHAISGAAVGSDPGAAAFRAGYVVLTQVQAADPGLAAWLLGLPHVGAWAHDCLVRLDQGGAADFAYFACLAAAAAIRAGMPFELDVPVRNGLILLPGLGCWQLPGYPAWTRLHCDGERVAAGDRLEADWRLLRPDDGSGTVVPQWSGTPLVRAVADGAGWNVLLETSDAYLDRYTLPMSASLSPDELLRWRRRIRSAWEVLVAHHRWAAGAVAEGISVIVPLTPQRDTDLVSATSPAAFGAISTSWPSDAVILAETLVHEFQHVKLGALLDMVPLATPGGEKVYAPWRQDPRPASGLLQGVYAHLGIVRFWRYQQHAGADPDDVVRAQVQFARWRPTIDAAVRTLLETGCLTSAGMRFAAMMQAEGRELASGSVPRHAQALATEAALDHWLTWQIRHVAVGAGHVTRLAAAYRRGEPCPEEAFPVLRISADTRKAGTTARSRLLNMRYLDPARYRSLCEAGTLPLSQADRLLLGRQTRDAIEAYRDLIADSADPQPDAWIGLALALQQLPPSPLQAAFAAYLPVMFEVHGCLADRTDPVKLADWFA